MRYSEIDLQCKDFTWFGVDSNNHVIAFTSGGMGNIPEYVCRSKEETKEPYDYFYDILGKTTTGHVLVAGENSLVLEFIELSSKGLYCFDVETQNVEGDIYKKITCPNIPILLDDLPDHVKAILRDHSINADLAEINQIQVPHAY